MSNIEVIWVVNEDTFQLLRQNFQRDENGDRLREDLTEAQSKKLKHSVVDYWKRPNIAGTDYRVIQWLIPDDLVNANDPNSGLQWLEFLLGKWANKITVVGVFNRNGYMYGITINPETGDMEGSPTYPRHAQYLKIFPDVDGLPATEPADVSTILGRSTRIW